MRLRFRKQSNHINHLHMETNCAMTCFSAITPLIPPFSSIIVPCMASMPSNAIKPTHDAAQQLLFLPLPAKRTQDELESVGMDIWTAASLNSENIQDFNLDSELNTKNSSRWSPLMYAAYLGHRELCKMLVMRGANVEDTNERGQTALMLAASCGAIEVVRILVDFSADFNRRDQYGRSSLHYAVKYYHAQVVALLLERGADPNLPDYNDTTCVLAACENGDENILANLLEFKGDPGRRNKQGQDGFAIATDDKLQMLLLRYRQEMEVDMVEMLAHLDLQKYTRNFADNGIRTLEALLQLTDKDLDKIGIGLIGPKRKLSNFIREKRDKAVTGNKLATLPMPLPTIGTSPPACLPLNVQQKLDQLTSEQKRLNAQCKQALMQILTNGRCSACVGRSPRRGSIEELISELDRMNARLGSFFF